VLLSTAAMVLQKFKNTVAYSEEKGVLIFRFRSKVLLLPLVWCRQVQKATGAILLQFSDFSAGLGLGF